MTSNFLKVRCEKCNNVQIIFERPASVIKCLVCDKVLAEPTGGKGIIKAKIMSIVK